jgi:hypothetical protein
MKGNHLTVVTAALLGGCSLGSFDYLSADFGATGALAGTGATGSAGAAGSASAGGSAGSVGSGGAPTEQPCLDQTDGTPCDDHDVCTRTSLCVSGVCQGSGERPCVIADTVAEFSTTQGLEGFWYGALPEGSDPAQSYDPDTDFGELLACPAETWRPACLEPSDPAFRWTLITAQLQHAATIPTLQIPVRRWVSDVSGPAFASLDHHHADPGDGDGTRAMVMVDGASVWDSQIDASAGPGRQEEIPVQLEVGTRVELLVHPRANQARDMTHFSMVLHGK